MPSFDARTSSTLFPAFRPFRAAARRIAVTFLAVGLVFPLSAWAQKDAGSIVGTVRDATGAVVPDAKITVTDMDRGATFVTTTSASGDYVASPLRIGSYKVTVEKQGFKTVVAGPVTLDVQTRAAVDVALEVGQMVQQVEVTEAAPVLETETSELGQVIDSRRMVNLPLNGRNFAQLAFLSAGVAPSEPGARDEPGFGFSANGGRSLQNNFLLDGVDNNSNLTDLLNETNYVIQPSIDAIQEFKVETNAYSAEFGRGNGAIVNATIKSGTNELHGNAFEFLRNDTLDGRNFFDAKRPPYRQNQFGATVGGPISIPGIYDGRNRTFFFGDYEGLRVRQGQTLTTTVPTLAQVAGDFSANLGTTPTGVLDCNGNPTYGGEIFNTRLTRSSASSPTGLCGVPIGSYTAAGMPTNIFPAAAIDPLAARLAALYPAPNASGAAGYNFLINPILNKDRNNFDVRVDHKFSDRDTSFYRFSYEDQPSIIPSVFQSTGGDGGGFFTGIEDNAYRSFALSETHIFNPRLVNEFRVGYNRIHSQRTQFNPDKNLSSQLGFPGVPFGPLNGGLPQLTFSDVATLGSPTFLPSLEIQNTYSYTDNLTWIRGKHSLRFGTEIRHEEFTIFQPADPRGALSFGTQFTDNPAAVGTGGSGFASFLLGVTGGGGINNLHNVDYLRPVYNFYVQDDVKLTPKLTLNLGLRYELFTTVKEKYDAQGTFDLGKAILFVPKSVKAQLTPTLASFIPLSATASRGLIPVDSDNFAPRVGFAYSMTKRLVVRGGYGVFYGAEENGPYSNPSPGFNPPFFVSQAFSTPCGAPSASPAPSSCSIPGLSVLSQGFPANSLSDPNTPLLFTIDPKLLTPYMNQWHLSTQYQLPSNTLLEVTYAGSKGTKLFTFFNGNQAAPSANSSAPIAPRRPVPSVNTAINLFSSTGNSNYNSLQVRVEKRGSHGLSYLAAYTWSHGLGEASNANLGAQNNDAFRYTAHPEWEYSNLDFDVRHRLLFSYTYDLPFGRGKHFLSGASGAANQLVGGWQLAGITTLSTGNWFTVTDSSGFSNSDSFSGQRPDQIGPPNGKPCVPGTFFNTCAFVHTSLGSFGNAGQNTLRGPGYQIWDASLFKNFQISERTRLEFRAEFFNFPNHANLQLAKSGPQNGINTTTLGTPQFGYLLAARDPRQIQFGLKFYY